MKAKLAAAIVGLAVVLGVVLAYAALYTVTEMEQAVITQFGEVVRVVSRPGLHLKMPFLQKTNFLEKRIMEWEGEPKQIPTLGKKYISVKTWARWRIVDPEKFFVSVRTETGGHAALDDQIESAVRKEISLLPLYETVRSSSNRQLEYVTEEVAEIRKDTQEVETGRDRLVGNIREVAAEGLQETYGIRLVDVQIKRLNYIERVREDVYGRMRSERQRIAAKYLSEARSQMHEIRGNVNRELDQITSEGYREARIIQGDADAEAASIYAEAYGRDPRFYSFLKALETYKETIDEDTVLVLSTDSAYFKYLGRDISPGGGAESP